MPPPSLQASDLLLPPRRLNSRNWMLRLQVRKKPLDQNHPDLVAMKGRRAALAAVAARDQSRQSSVGEPATASGLSVERAVQAQKSRVLAQSGKIGRLQQLHANVNLWRLQLNNASARAEGVAAAGGGQ